MRLSTHLFAVLVLCGLVLLGCASSSGVFPTGKDTYTVVVSTDGGVFTDMGKPAKEAYQQANEFCEAEGKVMQPIATTAKPFVTGGSRAYYELRFRALSPDDPEYRRPTLEAVPDTTIELRTP